MEETCSFCKIIRGEGEASFVFKDSKVVAFMDVSPVNRGHVLVVSKEHYQNIYELPNDIASHVFVITKRVATAVKRAFKAEGINIIQANETAAFQYVFHFHIHIIPRYVNDGFSFKVKRLKVNRQTLDKDAKQIAKVLEERDDLLQRQKKPN